MNKGKYYVINLERRQDRFESFKKNCPLDIETINKFEAIDGKLLKNPPDNFRNLNKGEIGCFLSHKLLWEKTLEEKDSDYSIIFEDDAIFTENFIEKFNDIINTNINFNILFIGGSYVDNYKMTKSIRVRNNIVKYDYSKEWDGDDCNRTTHAYIINKKTCQLLLDTYYKLLETNIALGPVDHYIMYILRVNKKDIHHAFPLLCHSNLVGDSDIR